MLAVGGRWEGGEAVKLRTKKVEEGSKIYAPPEVSLVIGSSRDSGVILPASSVEAALNPNSLALHRTEIR